MDSRLKITLKNQLGALSGFLFYMAIAIMLFIYESIFSTVSEAFFVIFGLYYLFVAFPALYLHIEYLYRNLGEEYELKQDRIIKTKYGKKQVYLKEDINRVIVYTNKLNFVAFNNYHYAKVFLKSGEKIYISCLLTADVNEALRMYLKEIPQTKVNSAFCTTLH